MMLEQYESESLANFWESCRRCREGTERPICFGKAFISSLLQKLYLLEAAEGRWDLVCFEECFEVFGYCSEESVWKWFHLGGGYCGLVFPVLKDLKFHALLLAKVKAILKLLHASRNIFNVWKARDFGEKGDGFWNALWDERWVWSLNRYTISDELFLNFEHFEY